jgi:multidrug efflux pump subunit AcrA (membrane-fusion protein)
VKRALIALALTPALLGLAAWGSLRLFHTTATASTAGEIPSAAIKRGDVIVTITAKGELQGGNSEMLYAPMAGGGALVITSLRESGEMVKAGDVVATFDTTDQEFKLREAEADLAEAGQSLIQAQAESRAKAEEARYALLQARADVRVAELECRRNEILAKIPAKENDLALAAARDKVRQLERDLADRLATAQAGIAIQEAAQAKARVAADTAKRNIESMTLRAKAGGYVARQQNMDGNFRWGSYIPALQVGDTVRAGMAVAQIPDLKNWEATARIGELDRGHLAEGQKAEVTVIALPGRKFKARIKSIGGTTGPPWDRHFDCRIAIEDPSPDLRPGMSARVVITTDLLRDVLWAPSQAVFESGGRKYVYARTDSGFSPRDVKLVRRSESQAVLTGVSEGQVIALANPDEIMKRQSARTGALQAIPR